MGTGTNWGELEQQILKVIKTDVRTVAVAFLDAEPVGVKEFEGTQHVIIGANAALRDYARGRREQVSSH